MQTISPSWSGVWAAEPALQRLSIAVAHPIQTERPGDWLLVSLKPSLEIASPCISFIAQDPIVALGPRSYFKLVTKHCQSDWHCVEICKSRLSFSKGRADWHRKNRATVAWEFPCCICKSVIVLVMLPFTADIVTESARMSQCLRCLRCAAMALWLGSQMSFVSDSVFQSCAVHSPHQGATILRRELYITKETFHFPTPL